MTDKPPIRLGLVGCGAVARRHARWLAEDRRAEWSVLVDARLDAARAFAVEFAPGAIVESDFLSAITRHELDAVVLCSPNALHYEQSCAALDRGLHVLCEKPLAVMRPHIDDLVARAAASGRIVSIAHQRRYKSAYTTARRELVERADRYGPVRQIHIFTCEHWSQPIAGTWRDDPEQNLGYCGDAGIHQIDVAYFLTGRTARRLYAVGELRDRRVQVVTRILAELDGGIGLAAHYVGDAHHWREDMHFHCRDADLLIRNEQVFRCAENRVEPVGDPLPEGDPATAFVDAVLSGAPTATPPEIARPIQAWNAAVAESLGRGEWVGVDVD